MKRNAVKCHLLVGTSSKVKIRTYNIDISNSKCEKLSEVKFDHKFDDRRSSPLMTILLSYVRTLVEKFMLWRE